MPAKYSYKEMVDSFYRNAYPEPNTGCWIWGASCINDGYGAIRFNIDGIIFYLAHRFSYRHHNGPFDQSLCVCHSCDNTFCVNPDHLFLGTHHENMIDRKNKGREAVVYGDLNPNAKVTSGDVRTIRNSPLTALQLSAIYGINRNHVMNIKNLKSWKNV